jgi:type VI secretion system protein ImpH
MFHHRMVSLFYRAWAIHQRTVGFDRPATDPFATFVGSFFGLGSQTLRDRDEVPDVAKYHFAGRLSQQVRCADGLADILTEYFGVHAEVEQFVGQWMEIPVENRCELGRSSEAGSLGVDLLLGTQTYDYQQRIRVRLGPMSLEDYLRFMPNRPSVRRLGAWVHTFCGIEVEWDIRIAIFADQVPRPQLGIIGELGWSVWLCGDAVKDDRDDLVFVLDESNVFGGN